MVKLVDTLASPRTKNKQKNNIKSFVAEMAELADAPGSGPGEGNLVGVQISLSAQNNFSTGFRS